VASPFVGAEDGVIEWRWARFDDLSAYEVYEMLSLRSRVFVVEQKCVYQDADGRDADAWHLLGWRAAGGEEQLVSYARVFEAGVRYEEMSIGRIVSAPEVRGSGVGRMIVEEAMRFCAERWPGQRIRIAAQRRLESFYTEFGFDVTGQPYIEDGIEHIDMLFIPTRMPPRGKHTGSSQ
jgi:ElaA protein